MLFNSSYSQFDQKCYICFSKSHQNDECPNRFTVTAMHPPNIDKDLLPRYMKLLTLEEKYFMTLSYPIIFDSVKLKPLKICYKEVLKFPSDDTFSSMDLVVADKAYIKSYNYGKRINSCKHVTFHLQFIEIKYSELLPSEFLQLLSQNTKSVICKSVEFRSNLNFVDVIEKAPNLEILDLCDRNVKVDNSWPDVLLRHCSERNFKYIYLPIPDLNFNLDNLAALMKKKSSNVFIYYLYVIVSSLKFNAEKAFDMTEDKFSKHFRPVKDGRQQCIRITYTRYLKCDRQNVHQDYVLKRD